MAQFKKELREDTREGTESDCPPLGTLADSWMEHKAAQPKANWTETEAGAVQAVESEHK